MVLADEGRISASSMTIPSALTLLVNVFPDPLEQARAIGLFGGCGSVANGEYPSYLIFYRVAGDVLQVLRILRAAQDYTRFFREDDDEE